MYESFQPLKISERVYWVGAIDWTLRDFHGYSTREGTTYNAYLVLGDRIALIDTVKAPFKDEMLRRIAGVVDPGKIDYIISNHAEMDHSGALPEVARLVKPEQVIASEAGVKTLAQHFHLDAEVRGVKEGESLGLGDVSLSFIETPMLHWPESMFTWYPEERILFSQDAFGMHLGSTERFDDELNDEILEWEAAKYYANILLPYSHLVRKQLDKMSQLAVAPAMIAPDHGPVWRKDSAKVVGLYDRWSQQAPTEKAVVVYDTMWESTALMARTLTDGLAAGGARVKLMNLRASHRSDVATELLEAGALLVGSPNMNNEIYPTVADVLTYLRGLKRQNLIGLVFASYGWSPLILKKLKAEVESLKVELFGDGIAAKYVPDAKILDACFTTGKLIAGKLRERAQASSAMSDSPAAR